MDFDIHVTRAEYWAESDESPISAEEWLALVQDDAELRMDTQSNIPYFALWSQHRTNNNPVLFYWLDGAIHTREPDRTTLGKALQIARQFEARVQGDDGEEYKRPEDLR